MTQALPGVKELIISESGCGKTHVVRTLLRAGIQPLVLATEPGMRALAPCDNMACAICKDTRDAPPIPWAYVSPAPGDIDVLIKQADLINTRDLKFLCNINDTDRKAYNQFGDVLRLCRDFVDNTGKSWGPIAKWNTDRALVLDSWSGLGPMAMNMFCGKRPAYDKSDYQVAQRALFNFYQLLFCGIRCHVIINGHVERGFTESGTGLKLTINTVGQKLAPDLPPLADDMIYADRNGDKFTWNTAIPNVITKARNLPLKDGIVPGYEQVIASWKRAGGKIEPTITGEAK